MNACVSLAFCSARNCGGKINISPRFPLLWPAIKFLMPTLMDVCKVENRCDFS